MDSYNYAHRSRSQSRFPQDEFPSLDRSHRSKSLDNRNQGLGGAPPIRYPAGPDSQGGYPVGPDPYYQGHKAHLQGERQQDQFFNDSITIPVQHVQGQAHQAHQAHHQESQSQRAGFEINQEAEEGEFTIYDRSVKYNQERTDYPPVAARQHHQQQYSSEGYSSRGHQAIQAPPSRYEDYSAQEIYKANQQQQQKLHVAQQESKNEAAYERQREMDEYTGGVSTFGRSAAGAAKSRSHHHHREWHHQSGGGAAASRAQMQQQQYANGGGYYSGGGTGFWGNRSKRTASWGGDAYKQTIHHKVNCCCFSFKWPPWSYEECEPPRPLFYDGRVGRGGAPTSMFQPPLNNTAGLPQQQSALASPSQLPPPQHPY